MICVRCKVWSELGAVAIATSKGLSIVSGRAEIYTRERQRQREREREREKERGIAGFVLCRGGMLHAVCMCVCVFMCECLRTHVHVCPCVFLCSAC